MILVSNIRKYNNTLPMPFYLTPEQDDYNKIPELQACVAEALYDVDSIVTDPGST